VVIGVDELMVSCECHLDLMGFWKLGTFVGFFWGFVVKILMNVFGHRIFGSEIDRVPKWLNFSS
jgi:hypothetical protein